ncbi:DUF456 family protein [Inhella sp.]|uniref:DUF456 family protein n=1 Tax=Inhella sp. TaxID=1921806 RepID=UPI0035B10BD6
MDLLLWILALGALLLGLLGLALPLLPGSPLLFGGAWLLAWLDDYQRVGGWTVALIGVLALLAWAIDYVAAVVGVKKAGASKQAMLGAGLGALLGLPLGLIGLIGGPVLGAMLGEYLARKDEAQAGKAGLAAGLAFVVAMAFKLGLGIAMLVVLAFAYFV